MQFKEMNIVEPILKALTDKNYQNPTPIQEQAIPTILNRNDVLGSAQTGTGKTAAFAIPIIQLLFEDQRNDHKKRSIQALVITPTRELAIQIGENFTEYAKYTGLKNTVIYGGVKQHSQVRTLRGGVDILVATPGRLLDLMQQGIISLKQVKYFVADEADRMLDMGFIHDIRKIVAALPRQRQSLFFSATMPKSAMELSSSILAKPVKIAVNPVSSTAETIKQHLFYTNKAFKNDLLRYIIEAYDVDQALVFAKTKHGADKIAKNLARKKISAAAIHGDKGQNQRQRALSQFKDKEIKILVATDIAARGIDIDKLRYVINFDIPNEPENYVHRIGRSGRAGKEGLAISICEPEENEYIKLVERLTKQRIKVIEDHDFKQTDKPMTEAEKKEFNKEKQRRKQEFFANRKKSMSNGSSRGNGKRSSSRGR